MENIVDLYKEISAEILDILKNNELENDKLDNCFEKRQKLINKLENENKINEFRNVYKEKLYNIDIEIKELFQVKISDTKKEIIEYKKNQNVNFAYTNMNKLNLNIFSKKV
jgi:hypothetical protein